VLSSLLCERAVVKAGATLQPGVVLSYGVVVGPNHSVPAGARVSLCRAAAHQVGAAGAGLGFPWFGVAAMVVVVTWRHAQHRSQMGFRGSGKCMV
jgi:hypothetical protein